MKPDVRPSWAFVSISTTILLLGFLGMTYLAHQEGKIADNALAVCLKPVAASRMQAGL